MKKHLTNVFELARELFPYSLLFYLALFLLETIFPGFVSNNMSLNWVLVVVIVFALVASFSKDETERREYEPPKRFDYLLIISLAILGAIIIFFKAEQAVWMKVVTSGFTGFLVLLLGITILARGDEIEPDQDIEEAITPENQTARLVAFKPNLPGKILAPALFILLATVLTSFLVYKKVTTKIPLTALRPSASPVINNIEDPLVFRGEIKVSEGINIKVLNGGAKTGAAKQFADQLLKTGYRNVFIGDLAVYNQENATISFRPEDRAQAVIIQRLLEKEYKQILSAPPTTNSAEILVILGNPIPISSESGTIKILE
jgi:hypothetical protein